MTLPVIESIVQVAQQNRIPNIERTVFVCVQHLLHTSIDIFEALIRLGVNPKNIFLLGKQYSTCTSVVNKAVAMGIQVQNLTPLQSLGQYTDVFNQDLNNMWHHVQEHIKNSTYRINTVVVLDDGGRCLKALPIDLPKKIRIVDVEQTTSGIMQLNDTLLKYAYIDVATSAAKTLEADMVTSVIFNKISHRLSLFNNKVVCGVVGLGAIGTAVAKKLAALGQPILLYDCNPAKKHFIQWPTKFEKNAIETKKTFTHNWKNIFINRSVEGNPPVSLEEPNVEWVTDLEALVQNADYIFGCTGTNFIQSLDIEKIIRSDKYFISCSSEDREFLSILHYVQRKVPKGHYNPLENIDYRVSEDITIHILKGGFPCNFDDSGTSVSENNIQLTRGLILGGLLQAMVSLTSYKRNGINGRIMLDPNMQQFIVSKWRNFNHPNQTESFSKQKLQNFMDLDWIIRHSGGIFHYLPDFFAYFDVKQTNGIERITV
jgi:hypothetical protein